jgi:hypothetical protein
VINTVTAVINISIIITITTAAAVAMTMTAVDCCDRDHDLAGRNLHHVTHFDHILLIVYSNVLPD